MKISIFAWQDDQYLSLENIVIALKDYCHNDLWTLNVIDAAPEPGAQALNEHNPDQTLSYNELLKLVSPNVQIIDGEAISFEPNSKNGKLLIRAIDSTSWEIETDENTVSKKIEASYPWATILEK